MLLLVTETEAAFTYCHYIFTVFRLLTDFVCLYDYEFCLSLCKIVRTSVILLLPLSTSMTFRYKLLSFVCTWMIIFSFIFNVVILDLT
jgi:hypothetical protein